MTVSAFRDLDHGRMPGDPPDLPGRWAAASARVFADTGLPAPAAPLGYEDEATPATARTPRGLGEPGPPGSRSAPVCSARPWQPYGRSPTGCTRGSRHRVRHRPRQQTLAGAVVYA
ncbi:hypothetical protein [Streptomyces sp. NBC_00316]|uniref:hypothetical protein n=1 Tax=Streptomyces sp. NBC_00316 TaxID=2975710 RepID=UPI003FA7DD43